MGLISDETRGLLNEDSLAEARKGKIIYLDLDQIIPNPDNIGTISEEEIAIKAENIQEVGLLQPLLVMRVQGGFMLNTGHKRLAALKRLRDQGIHYMYMGRELIDTAPCQYLEKGMDENTFNLIAIASNAHHPDAKEEKKEKVQRLHDYYKKLAEEGKKPAGREREWITAITGISDGTVKSILAGINADEKQKVEPLHDSHSDSGSKDLNHEVTRKMMNFEKFLKKIDLQELTDLERQNLNEIIRELQDMLEELISVSTETGK